MPSIPCPKCAGKSHILDSRPALYEDACTVRRRRECECGFRFTTVEILRDSLDRTALERGNIQKIIAKIREILP